MNSLKVDIMRTLFLIYCAYAFYSCLVVFYRPDERGAIFRNLRIPLVVFVYFLIPCVALYLVYRAFWRVHTPLFGVGVVLVLPLSFLIILYFVTSQDWPVGRLLAIDKVSTNVMRVLLSVNLALSVVVAGASAITLYAIPATIRAGEQAQEYTAATQTLQQLVMGDDAKYINFSILPSSPSASRPKQGISRAGTGHGGQERDSRLRR
jgi:hypothetical protein